MVHPNDRTIAEQSARELLERGHTETTYRIVRPDGVIRWLLDRKYVIYNEAGQPHYIGGIANDITGRKLAEAALWQSRQAFLELLEQVPEVTYTDEIGGNWRYLGPNILSLCGYTADEFLADSGLWLSLIYEEDRARLRAQIDSLSVGDVLNAEYRIKTRDRGLIWVRDHGVVKADSDTGRPLIQGLIGWKNRCGRPKRPTGPKAPSFLI